MEIVLLIVIVGGIVLLYAQQAGGAVIQNTNWPSGDPIWSIAQAIAKQEGFGVVGSAPTRNHNPGDISDGADTYGYDPAVTSSHVTSFPDDNTGWTWLYNKLTNIANGNSSVYDPGTSWIEIGSHWAADPNWPIGVAANLGVDPNSTMNDYLQSQGW